MNEEQELFELRSNAATNGFGQYSMHVQLPFIPGVKPSIVLLPLMAPHLFPPGIRNGPVLVKIMDHIGIIIERRSRSAVIVLYDNDDTTPTPVPNSMTPDQAGLYPDQDQQYAGVLTSRGEQSQRQGLAATFLREKDISLLILHLQEVLHLLQGFPAESEI